MFSVLNFIFNPFKALSYYSQYYQIAEQILVHKNKRIIWTIRMILLIILIKSFHFAFLAFNQSQTTILEHSLHFDFIWLVTGKSLINIFSFLISNLTCYIIYCLLLDVNLSLIRQLYQTLILNDPFHFISSFVVDGGNFGYQKASFDNCAHIQKYFLVICRLFHMFTLASSKRISL